MKRFTKLTRCFVLLAVACALLFTAAEYKDFRRYEQIRKEWQGREWVIEGLEVKPHPPLLARTALVLLPVFFLCACVSVAIDIRRLRGRKPEWV
jgi:hypothetical protein